MFARPDHIAVHLGMQVMGHGAVHRLHFRVGQHLFVVRIKVFCIRHPAEPIQVILVQITGRYDHRAGQIGRQMQPPLGNAGKLPAHQTTADHPKTHGLVHSAFSFPRSRAVSSSSIMASSRSVMGSVRIRGSLASATGGQLGL